MSQSRHGRGLCRECGREISLTKPGNSTDQFTGILPGPVPGGP